MQVNQDQSSKRPEARAVRPGEMLAIKPEALHSGPQGFFWLFGGGSPENERRGNVAIVHVRGALDHHDDSWGENYESILTRVDAALTGDDVLAKHRAAQQRHAWANDWKKDYQPLADIEVTKPAAVVLNIDSPGGAVSGLFESVAKLRAKAEEAGIPLIAYANEMAASAAYALACACSKIYCPKSAIVGSIGVIATMASQAKADKKAGIDYRLITSGARKGDGHPHKPIDDAAVTAEQGRVDALAKEFWRLVRSARGLPMRDVASYEADIFLGPEAKQKRLVNGVMSFDDLIAKLDKPTPADTKTNGSSKNYLDVAHSGTKDSAATGTRVPRGDRMKLDALIQKTTAALAKETDPVKLASLHARLGALLEASKDEDEDCDDDEDEDDEDESKAAKKKAEADADLPAAAKPPLRPVESEKEDEDESKAALALIERATGQTGSAAIGAAMAMFGKMDQAIKDTASLKASAVASERQDLLKRATRYCPPHLVKALETQKLASIRAFVAEAEKGSPMVATEEGGLLIPAASTPNTKGALPKDLQVMVDSAVAAMPASFSAEKRAAFEADLVRKYFENEAKALNGAGGRY